MISLVCLAVDEKRCAGDDRLRPFLAGQVVAVLAGEDRRGHVYLMPDHVAPVVLHMIEQNQARGLGIGLDEGIGEGFGRGNDRRRKASCATLPVATTGCAD
jgi:hypothetical protein